MGYVRGKDHHKWSGDTPNPGTAMHRRVTRERGRARNFPCEFCGVVWDGQSKWAIDWSLKHGFDPFEISSYQSLCRKCHMLYDKSGLTAEQVLAIREDLKGGIAQWRLGEKYKVSQMTISRIHRRETWTHL